MTLFFYSTRKVIRKKYKQIDAQKRNNGIISNIKRKPIIFLHGKIVYNDKQQMMDYLK